MIRAERLEGLIWGEVKKVRENPELILAGIELLDRQCKSITERLDALRARLDDYRARESAEMESRALGERVVEWANRVGDRLDDLPDAERREALRLLLDEVTIDGENNINLTLAIPTEDLTSIGTPVSR